MSMPRGKQIVSIIHSPRCYSTFVNKWFDLVVILEKSYATSWSLLLKKAPYKSNTDAIMPNWLHGSQFISVGLDLERQSIILLLQHQQVSTKAFINSLRIQAELRTTKVHIS